MDMPSTLYVSVNHPDADCIDPRDIAGDDLPKDHYLVVHRRAQDVAEEGTVFLARYKFLGLVAVTQHTERKITVEAAEIPDFGCSPEAIARAEAEAEARAISRLTGRDPHQCVKCHAVDCVCTKLIPREAIDAARVAANSGA